MVANPELLPYNLLGALTVPDFSASQNGSISADPLNQCPLMPSVATFLAAQHGDSGTTGLKTVIGIGAKLKQNSKRAGLPSKEGFSLDTREKKTVSIIVNYGMQMINFGMCFVARLRLCAQRSSSVGEQALQQNS